MEDVENIHFQMDALMHVALKTGQWEALPEETKNALLVASEALDEWCPGCWVCGGEAGDEAVGPSDELYDSGAAGDHDDTPPAEPWGSP